MSSSRRSKGRHGSKKGDAQKIFRLTVLGRAECGKTAFCTQFVTNHAVEKYEHTQDRQMFLREVSCAVRRCRACYHRSIHSFLPREKLTISPARYPRMC